MNESPYVRMFREYVPPEYLRGVLEGLAEAYPEAYQRAYEDFAPPEAKNYVPGRRRAIVEGMLRKRAAGVEGVVATAELDPHSRWWNHTRIVCGNRVILTENKVPHADHVVRHSIFREQYAQENGQLRLFEFDDAEPQKPPKNETLYGIILHGIAYKQPWQLGFAVVRFPLPDITGYYPGTVNLFREFPGVVPRPIDRPQNEAPQENIDDEPDIDFNTEEGIG